MMNETRNETKDAGVVEGFVFPASFAQQRLWFLDQLEPGSAVYSIPEAIRLGTALDVPALERSLHEIIRRHEVLRTTLAAVDGQPVQVIWPEQTLHLPMIDLSSLDPAAREAKALRLATEEAERPFDLTRWPLFRVRLLRLEPKEHVLLVTMHHIISDGWSLGVFFRELAALYEAFSQGKPSPLPPLPIQYADYAVWQRESMQGERLQTQVSYWKAQLAGAPALLELPADRPRPAVQSFRGSRMSIRLPKDLTGALHRLSRTEGVTLFMALLAAFQTLLSRYTGQEDIVVGSPIAGRNRTETEGLIGLFVNTLALRTDLSGDPTFRELLRRVSEVTLGAYAHQDFPLEKLVEELQPARSLSHAPLFQVIFALENRPQSGSRFPGLGPASFEIDRGVSRSDLAVFMREEREELFYILEYNTDLFDAATMTRLTEHFETLLRGIVEKPEERLSRLPLLTAAERHRILFEWNDTRQPHLVYPCMHRIFEEHARRTPDSVAAVCGGQSLTYGELNKKANQLAHFLRKRGVGPEVLVGICVRRSLEMVVGLLGVLKAGGAYVPIDPAYPKERISFLLKDAAVAHLLTQQSLVKILPRSQAKKIALDASWKEIESESGENPTDKTTSENLAYAIYTSGSTGWPKGVLIRHGSVANLFAATQPQLGFDHTDVWTVFHSYAFDLSVWEIWGALLHGGRLVLVPPELTQSPVGFAQLLAQEGVTVLSQTPAAARQLADVRGDPAARAADWKLRLVICGGEALSADLAEELLSWKVPLWNFYGPTEATVWTTIKRVDKTDCRRPIVSIGRPIANTEAYVLDRHFETVPVGVSGNLFIGGEGLARGYLRRPELSRERFIPNPFQPEPGSRLYRTGDLARWLSSGDIEFLGREDHQVKIRGYRVELGEIEAALAGHPSVREAAVLAEDEAGDKRLVAYVVPQTRDGATAGVLRSFLQAKLPEYMVPQAFVALEAFPLTRNGKLDRQALPAPDHTRPSLESSFVAARTPTEDMLAAVWRDLLGLDRVGIDDNFFELGGHSLKATQMVSRVRAALGVDLPLRSVFEFPTITALARRIEAVERKRSSVPASPLRRIGRDRPLPLSFGQQRLWFLDQLEPGSCAYNVYRAIRLKGPLDESALARSLEALVKRHESLRTRFTETDGKPAQIVFETASAPLRQVDLRGIEANAREERAQQLASEEVAQAFDLAQGPLWRVLLLRLSDQEYALVLTIHHIVSDGWSLGVLFEELVALYSGFCAEEPASLPDLPIQYADYAFWQREWLSEAELAKLLVYWRAQLAGAPPVIVLPTDRSRPDAPSHQGDFHVQVLPQELTRSLNTLARTEGVTLFTTLVAAFQALLARQSGSRDIVVGTDVANRNRIETERLVGFFVNLLPLRTSLSGNPSFRELLSRTRETAFGAYAHQDMPFEKLVEDLAPTRARGINPLVQVLIVQNPLGEDLTLPGLAVEDFPIPNVSCRFDLVLFVSETEMGLRTSWLFSSDLFDAPTIAGMSADFETLLGRVVADPETRLDDLEELTKEDTRREAMEKRERREAQASRLRDVRRQKVDLSRAAEVTTGFLAPGLALPLLLQPAAGGELDLADWARSRRDFLEEKLLKHGAILFRGFGVESVAEFERLASALCPELFGEYGDLPREAMGGKVYGSTPYPSDQPILFHNESSHMHRWPMKIWFYCVLPSQSGGETPIVDCRTIYNRLDPALRQRFSDKGLLYVRNYTEGLDVSWQSFYGTDDRRRVEEACARAGTELEWTKGNGLRTRQRSPAVIRHPQTGEMSFFNQLQLHHVSFLEPAVRESLSAMMREEELPRNVYYGDGSPIEDSVMEEILALYRATAVQFSWQAGDILMVNNMLVAHSRNPYVGARKIVVAMGEMVNKDEVSS